MLEYKVLFRDVGEHPWNVSLLEYAWNELPELQMRSLDDYIETSIALAMGTQRVEVYAIKDYKVVGITVLIWHTDVHVGTCLSNLHTYILPEYRGLGISREFTKYMRHFAKGEPYSQSHRKGTGKYYCTYRR